MIIGMIFTALFAWDNADFFRAAAEQRAQGYHWEYVGRSTPAGTPAITMKIDDDEYILYRLTR